MADLVNGKDITFDQRMRATCPACFALIKWEKADLSNYGSYRAVHEDCGLQFHAVVKLYSVMVLDEHGNPMGENLEQPASGAPAPEVQETPNTELGPGGVVMIKTGMPGEQF